ncbi:MAG: hypothetical protein JF607_05070 [Burkholderiales bacterium]|jgi:putative peptide zinc metalloprotease protein|nr:hypothetical protein [Burkholderiales bacterium]
MVSGTLSKSAGPGAQLVSGHWYRVASLKPRLREGLVLHPQRARGRLWCVVEDRINGRYHRIDAAAWRLVRLFDGESSVERIWQRLSAQAGERLPSQDDLLALMSQLHALDLLDPGTVPDLAEQHERDRQQSRRQWRQRWLNPMALRFPLLDPDRWLRPLVEKLRPVLGRGGMLAWLAWVLPALALAGLHWREITQNFGEQLLAFDNLLLLALLFPLVKVLHELGHAVACKLHGGEVHDAGVMLLLFLPVPYVEASSSWTFPDKQARILVGAAGVLVELAIAALAFYLWLLLEPGIARALAYDVAVLASLTTLLFNGNPLLRYDGYYVASDALEIPNLAPRAAQYWRYLVEHFVLRREHAVSPAHAPGEAGWFLAYAPLSFAYRLVVSFSIAAFVATQYFAIGAALAMCSLATGVGLPLWKVLGWLQRIVLKREAGAGPQRTVAAGVVVLLLGLVLLPLPYRSQGEGVLSLPADGELRAGQGGFVETLAVQPGERVDAGTLIARLRDPALERELTVQLAREAAAQARFDAALADQPARVGQFRTELEHEQAASQHQRAHVKRLEVHARSAGRLWLEAGSDLPGRWLREGQTFGSVVDDTPPHVRVIVDPADADVIRRLSTAVQVRLPFDVDRVWTAHVVQAVPAAGTELPSAALGRQGGGAVPTDPRDEQGRKALLSHFEYELDLPADFPYRLVGSRVSVRFVHPDEPLGPRLWRLARRQFLGFFKT